MHAADAPPAKAKRAPATARMAPLRAVNVMDFITKLLRSWRGLLSGPRTIVDDRLGRFGAETTHWRGEL